MAENNKLIVYYSYTKNTEMIVKKIKEKVDCDVLEIKPVVPYSDNYDEVVRLEQNNETAKKTPPIEKINIDLEKYEEIIIGTPVWWYTIAPVIRTFLKENDLSGKKIIPFATNGGWVGRTFKEIEELCPNSRIENKMNIVFEEKELNTQIQEIENWINSL